MNLLRTAAGRAKRLAVRAVVLVNRVLAALGFTQSEARLASDAQRYWAQPESKAWTANSHWRTASVFEDDDLWSRLGQDHLRMLERGARLVGSTRPWNRIVEWGCGGGANAVQFAPRATEFVGVDISQDTLDECARQVAAVCDTPFTGVLIEVGDPEAAQSRIASGCDVFLCCYVFELIPSPEYGARLLRIAHDLLAPGGLALIQVKYDDGRWTTRPRRRAYSTALAEMTTYPIAGFWQLASDCGLTPEMVQVVPRNELDERYAYFLLTKPGSGDSP